MSGESLMAIAMSVGLGCLFIGGGAICFAIARKIWKEDK